jgi:hypothetical protein
MFDLAVKMELVCFKPGPLDSNPVGLGKFGLRIIDLGINSALCVSIQWNDGSNLDPQISIGRIRLSDTPFGLVKLQKRSWTLAELTRGPVLVRNRLNQALNFTE